MSSVFFQLFQALENFGLVVLYGISECLFAIGVKILPGEGERLPVTLSDPAGYSKHSYIV